MVKKFKDFYTQKKVNTVPDETEESQEELNSRLNRSIIMNNSWEFNDSIKKGADINNISVGGINKDNIEGLTKDKKEVLSDLCGVVKSHLDFNKIRDLIIYSFIPKIDC